MTPSQMDQVHVALDHVGTLSFEQIGALGDQAASLSRDQWADVMGPQAAEALRAHRSVGVDIMAGTLDEATSLGVSVPAMESAVLLTDPRVESLTRWVAENMATPALALMKLASIGQKLVLEGPRAYTYDLSDEVGTTARRFAQPDACEWCRYIAAQEHRYEHYGSEWVNTNKNDRFHEHCRCVLIPAVEYIEPDYVKSWSDDLDVAQKRVQQKYGRELKNGRKVGGGYGANTWKKHMAELRLMAQGR